MELSIENRGGKATRELASAVSEFTEALADRRCGQFTWTLKNNNTYAVMFNLDNTKGLKKDEIREAVREFNDGDWGMVCSICSDVTFTPAGEARSNTVFDKIARKLNRVFYRH